MMNNNTVFQDNLFEWHFTVRGPPDTDFASKIFFVFFCATFKYNLFRRRRLSWSDSFAHRISHETSIDNDSYSK